MRTFVRNLSSIPPNLKNLPYVELIREEFPPILKMKS